MPRMPVSTVYVENSNNKSSLEDVMCANDVVLTFQNQRFGSNSQFRFPRTYQMLGPVICNFKVKYAGTGGGTIGNNCGVLSDYIAHSMIEEYYWTVGGTELLRVKGEHIVPIQLDRCESEMKKRKVLEYSGTRLKRTTDGYLSGNKIINYQCLLELPWSTIATKNLYSRKYFPIHQLSEALELSVVLRPKNQVFQDGTGGDALVSLEQATLNFEYQKFGNPEMMKNQVYRFPFTYYDCRRFPISKSAGQQNLTVDLTGFRKGEVKQIQYHLVNQANIGKADKNLIYDGELTRDAILRFNGQIIWRANGSDNMWDLIYSDQPSVHGKKEISITAGVNTFILHKDQNKAEAAPLAGQQIANQIGATHKALIVDGYAGDVQVTNQKGVNDGHGLKYYYTIPIAQILDKYQRQGHVLGGEFTKNQISLEFNLQRVNDQVETYNLYATYYYQCLYQNDGESSLLIF